VPSAGEQYLQALASLSDLTRTQAERVASLLAKQGEVQSAQVNRVTEDLMRRTQKNREILTRMVQREVKRQLGVLGMASRDEVARLQQRVRALEQEVERSLAKSSSARPSAASVTQSSPAAATPAARTRASSSGSAAKPATRAKAGSSGTTSKSSTRSRSASSSGAAAKPSTRTRTGGASSRSTASSPGTRRTRSPKGSAGSGSSDTGSGSGG
jgi:polyhydroxyalkanoate synthesis regulator phasin